MNPFTLPSQKQKQTGIFLEKWLLFNWIVLVNEKCHYERRFWKTTWGNDFIRKRNDRASGDYSRGPLTAPYISIYGTSCLLPAYAFHIESVSYAVSSDFCLKFRAMAIHCLVFQETEHTRDLPLVAGLALHALSLAGCRGLSSLSHSLAITAKEQRWSRRTKKKASQKTDWLSC